MPWYDIDKIRRCEDGNLHEGKLELITWSTPANESNYEEALGWGAVIEKEAEDHKKKFEEEFGGDEKKLYDYWPRSFRWTCCGTPGDQSFGCDHHGSGSKPCTCDFCKMGKPLTNKIHNERLQSAHGQGLALQRGPDPRSKEGDTAITELMRHILGLDK